MTVGQVRKFIIDKKRKPNCKLPGDEMAEISIQKTDEQYEVIKYEKDAYIDCDSGFIHYVTAKGDTNQCGIGTILTSLCFNEEKKHNVKDNKENEAMKSIDNWVEKCKKDEKCKGQEHQEKLETLKKWSSTECSKLISLYNTADPKNRAFLYFKSALETGYDKMFIKKDHIDMYPEDDCRSVEILKERFNGNGEMIEGNKKVDVTEKYWFFCKPYQSQANPSATPPECK